MLVNLMYVMGFSVKTNFPGPCGYDWKVEGRLKKRLSR